MVNHAPIWDALAGFGLFFGLIWLVHMFEAFQQYGLIMKTTTRSYLAPTPVTSVDTAPETARRLDLLALAGAVGRTNPEAAEADLVGQAGIAPRRMP